MGVQNEWRAGGRDTGPNKTQIVEGMFQTIYVALLKIRLKNHTSKPSNDLSFNIFHYKWSNFEIKFCLKFYHQGARISNGHNTSCKLQKRLSFSVFPLYQLIADAGS